MLACDGGNVAVKANSFLSEHWPVLELKDEHGRYTPPGGLNVNSKLKLDEF
jgi:hypothetical protein